MSNRNICRVYFGRELFRCAFCSQICCGKTNRNLHRTVVVWLFSSLHCSHCSDQYDLFLQSIEINDYLKWKFLQILVKEDIISKRKYRLMSCPFTGPKMFCAGPNFLSQTKNLFMYCTRLYQSQTFCARQKMICIQCWHKSF